MFTRLMRSVPVNDFTITESEPMIDVLTVASGRLAGSKFVMTNPITPLLGNGPIVINFFTTGLRRRRFAQAWRDDFVLADLSLFEDTRVSIAS